MGAGSLLGISFSCTMYVCAHMPQCPCGGQGTTFGTQFFSFAMAPWVPDLKLGSSGLDRKCFSLLSHFPGPVLELFVLLSQFFVNIEI